MSKCADEPLKRLRVDWLGDESVRRDVTKIGTPVPAHQHARHIGHGGVVLQRLHDFSAAETRHRVVAQDQCGMTFARHGQTEETVCCDDRAAVFAFNNRTHELDEIGIVVDYNDNWLA